MEVNLVGPLAMTQAFMAMLRRSRGRSERLFDHGQGGCSFRIPLQRFKVRTREALSDSMRPREAVRSIR
jgi:hypothetical protein